MKTVHFIVTTQLHTAEDTARRLAAHTLVIDPLIKMADECVMCCFASRPPKVDFPPVLKRARARYYFDMEKLATSGFERFWNAAFRDRGAVTFSVDVDAFLASNILESCQGLGATDSDYQFTLTSPRASLTYAQEVIGKKRLPVTFLSNNGISPMFMGCSKEDFPKLKERFKGRTGRFVRKKDAKGAPEEIIIDQPPYSNAHKKKGF